MDNDPVVDHNFLNFLVSTFSNLIIKEYRRVHIHIINANDANPAWVLARSSAFSCLISNVSLEFPTEITRVVTVHLNHPPSPFIEPDARRCIIVNRTARCSSFCNQVVLVVLATYVAAMPADDVIPIISQSQEGPNPDGSYKWSYETGNGIKAEEEGHLENVGAENEAMSAKGGFSYTADDGQPIALTYVADENGFQPVGAHLPTTPEIPPLILKALEWNAAHPSKEDQEIRK
ncbi:hypothetical protein HN011_008445 [Eciton burchellii]|nr:hypothetical protein HN011_008445 [Eciton burchellii]